ncbi:MAG: preQ(1) synthase [Candidatus Ratteibacteria bacterium]|nr:preQ(1) synthase [Candidatus Ratteibacteria bacterium]
MKKTKSGKYKKYETAGLDVKLPELECFENQFPSYTITIIIPEYTSLCPKTGQPDFGIITIEYEPDKLVLELKSLKTYIQSYRNLGIFYENAVNRIKKDIVRTCKPKWLKIKGDFNPRGGIKSIIESTYTKTTS